MLDNKLRKRIISLLAKRRYGLTIEDISSLLHIHRATASKYLAVLEEGKKIHVRVVGKAKLHYLKKHYEGRRL